MDIYSQSTYTILAAEYMSCRGFKPIRAPCACLYSNDANTRGAIAIAAAVSKKTSQTCLNACCLVSGKGRRAGTQSLFWPRYCVGLRPACRSKRCFHSLAKPHTLLIPVGHDQGPPLSLPSPPPPGGCGPLS